MFEQYGQNESILDLKVDVGVGNSMCSDETLQSRAHNRIYNLQVPILRHHVGCKYERYVDHKFWFETTRKAIQN